MAQHFSSSAVISFFSGEDREGLGKVVFEGSDDELGMEDEMYDDSEPALEITGEGNDTAKNVVAITAVKIAIQHKDIIHTSLEVRLVTLKPQRMWILHQGGKVGRSPTRTVTQPVTRSGRQQLLGEGGMGVGREEGGEEGGERGGGGGEGEGVQGFEVEGGD